MAKKASKAGVKKIIRKAVRTKVVKKAPAPPVGGSSNGAARTHQGGSRSVEARSKKVAKIARKAAKKVGERVPASEKLAKAAKMVYFFGADGCEGDGTMRELLGGKGANLAEMANIGLPVPPGFTITTATCERYYQGGKRLPHGLMNECHKHMNQVQKEVGKVFGDHDHPLLVSVRSGAPISMPGMMDTVLNLGLNDESVEGLAEATGNRRFAFDSYRRLINMFGDVVMGVEHKHFEAAFDRIKAKYHAQTDADVPEEGIVELADAYQKVYRKRVGDEFPQNPFKQLELAIEAVFESWHSDRAIKYRRLNNITGINGTAVNVQAMVYGNMGDDSGTGVAFTRNPSTGENQFFGEFLINAQGEDVVAGIRTPKPTTEMAAWDKKAYKQLLDIKDQLEGHFHDVQDIEFTIEGGKLWMLQTRRAKRTGPAAVRVACDMVKEGLLTEEEALLRIPAGDLIQLLLPSFEAQAKSTARVVARGLPASPGAAVGKPAFTADEAVERTQAGEDVILVRRETSPEDVEGMHAAAGILTSTGGMTSHAAVVARGWGTCCVAGAEEIDIDEAKGEFSVGKRVYGRDDLISLDGSTGEVLHGSVARTDPKPAGDFAKVMRWADKHRRLDVRANADTPEDARRARELGAQGIGLCRTEHMFFEHDRIMAMREMILAENAEARTEALAHLLPYQRDDFIGLFEAMKGLPVTIRLLDPPLHEFVPNEPKLQKEIAKDLGVPVSKIANRVVHLHESNPMMGHRGCRLAVTYPEILKMQVRAIAEATIECLRRKVRAMPEIMIPLVGTAKELSYLKERCLEAIHEVRHDEDYPGRLDIKIGTMIEIPRAALTADKIAEHADFFSFGTNDLTQLTFGYSRDDVNEFLPSYLEHEILEADPFEKLDASGVGELVRMAAEKGRGVNEGMKLGLCGEHGGEPSSVHLVHSIGLDYVSCSPYRVPIARLAAAQAVLMEQQK